MWWIIGGAVVVIVAIPVIWFARLMSKEGKELEEIERAGGVDAWSKNTRDRISKNDESVRRSKARVQKMEEASRKTNDFSDILNALEQQLGQSLFSDVELKEITENKEHLTDLSSHATDVANQATKLMEKHIELTERATKLVEKGISKENTEKLDSLYAGIDSIDAKLEVADKDIIACEQALFVSRTKVEQWVELGKTRSAK